MNNAAHTETTYGEWNPKWDRKFEVEVLRTIGDAGRAIHVEMYEPAKGGGWFVSFDTEYAALKMHYNWAIKHAAKNIYMDRCADGSGWYVSKRG